MAGYREFQTGEVLTSANVNDFLMNQSVMVFADAAARNTALGTAIGGSNALVEGMMAYLADSNKLEFYDGSVWKAVGMSEPKSITATGGSTYEIIDAGLVYKVHKFTSSGSFVVSSADTDAMVQYLIVAGGGGGGGAQSLANNGGGGGGGGGGVLSGATTVTAQTYTITVGAGGTGGANGASYADGTAGANSVALGGTAIGGGYGGRGGSSANNGGAGGSAGGGGGADAYTGWTSAAYTEGQGNYASQNYSYRVGKSGGGAGSPAGPSFSGFGSWTIAGDGIASDFDGNLAVYGAGGLGGNNSTLDYVGTQDGYGRGGAGGAGSNKPGLDGGDGVVIIRYPVRFV